MHATAIDSYSTQSAASVRGRMRSFSIRLVSSATLSFLLWGIFFHGQPMCSVGEVIRRLRWPTTAMADLLC